MSRHVRGVLVVVGLVAAGLAGEGRCGAQELQGIAIDGASGLDGALQRVRETHGDVGGIEAEISVMLVAGDGISRRAALAWVSDVKGLTNDERIALISFCLARPLSVEEREGLRDRLATVRLNAASQEDRRRVYWEAVRDGTAATWEGRRIERSKALVSAVEEGMAEFEAFVVQYGGLLDDPRDVVTPKATDRLLWKLRLRRGAKDQGDGARLQAARVSELGVGEFDRLMAADAAFRYTTIMLAKEVCADPKGAPCQNLRSLASDPVAGTDVAAGTSAPSPRWSRDFRSALRVEE
jgi:hypothetical protein